MSNAYQLDETRDIIIKEYIALRRLKVPYYAGSAELPKLATKAAEICIANEFDPVVYVKAQYRKCGAEAMWPSLLVQQNNAINYKDYLAKRHVSDEHYFDSQLHDLMGIQSRTHFKLADILSEPMYGFTAWFRVVITPFPEEQVIAKYKYEARKELEENPDIKAMLLRKGVDVERIYA